MLELHGIRKSFKTQRERVSALRRIDMTVPRREFFVLLGPSGCGKTTILRSVAGLELPDQGVIRIDGETVYSAQDRLFVPPERRPIAMVFQSYAVWPHMNVYENIAFPLREGLRPLPAAQLRARVDETLSLLDLTELADRFVTTLSGGQQQRVALARALALRPKVLLMDEPLSNLDFKLQIQLRTLVRHFDLTTVYVTHNQAEAMEIGDRIAVVDRGEIVQTGAPREIYRAPADEFVARFIGEMSFLPAQIMGQEADYAVLETASGRMRARAPRPAGLGPCLLGIRPEDLMLVTDDAPEGNVLEGLIQNARFLGDTVIYAVRVGDAEVTFRAHHRSDLVEGARVRLAAAAEDCVAVLPARHRGDVHAS